MQRANKNQSKQKKAGAKAKQNIGDKRPRPASMARAPIAYPVRQMKASVRVVTRAKDSTIMSILQPFFTVTNQVGATQNNVLVNNSLATLTGGTFMCPLCPSNLNGSVLAEAQIWTEHRFKKITCHYIPTCPTTQPGALVFGTTDQVATVAGGDINSFAVGRAVRNAVTTSVYQPLSWDIELNQSDSIFRLCDGTITSALVDKLLYNKCFFGMTDIAAPLAAIAYGYLNIEFVIEFNQLMTNQTFTLGVDSMEHKLVLASIRDTLFPKRALLAPTLEPVDGVNFLLSRLGLKRDCDASSASSVKSWVSGGR